ncbi:MAG TPA: DoxX family protein [Parcubacteria group bacterium]|nr:DoxX family protein [Parcubacteria group bacterium]
MNINREKFVHVSLVLLRIVAGLLFLQHGGQKLFGWFGSGMSMGELPTLILVAGLLEAVGGLLIVIGAFVRPVALVLSGEMAFAYFMAHFANGFWPLQNGGEAATLFAFIFLFFAAHGGGLWSVDAWLKSRNMGVQM